MNTLWTFGDSFTFGHGCRIDGPLPEYCKNYKKELDDIWPNHLGKMLNLKVKNFGKSGASNDFIIDSIIDNWNYFKENDFIIIGITYHNRFDVPLNNEMMSIFPNMKLSDRQKELYKKEEIEAIINFQYYFSNDELYKNRYLKRLNFLDKILKEKKINTFLWEVRDKLYSNNSFETITNATNGKINDGHLSFKGHIDFANVLYKKLIIPRLI